MLNFEVPMKGQDLASTNEINEAFYTWYNLARESLVPVNGPVLQEEALEISSDCAVPILIDSRLQVAGLKSGKLYMAL